MARVALVLFIAWLLVLVVAPVYAIMLMLVGMGLAAPIVVALMVSDALHEMRIQDMYRTRTHKENN